MTLAGGLTSILGFDVMYPGAQLVEWSLSVGIEGLLPPSTCHRWFIYKYAVYPLNCRVTHDWFLYIQIKASQLNILLA